MYNNGCTCDLRGTRERRLVIPLKHRGITFDLAQEVFDDEHRVVLENYHFADESEQRMQAIGMSRNLLLVVVIFVDRSAGSEIVIHHFSEKG
ncbi:MAG TPA: BrnT family toxin [Bryobacteraceae bacterium]|jgi:uncharacterized DUF497 family protein